MIPGVIEHGTRRGFQQHRYTPCDACREANNTYMREYMRANYDPAIRRARYLRSKAQTHVQEAA